MANGKTDREPGRQTVGSKGDRQPKSPTVGGKTDREMGYGAGKGDREKPSSSYPRIGFGAITPPGTSSRMLSQKFSTKYAPGDYAAYRKALIAKMPAVAAKKPVAKPVVKPAAAVSNVVREKLSPTKKMPPATRFGTVTGKTTGTRVSGGGGYGGGGTRGGGSLSGGGSGTRSAGTSRTGGTRSNDPVRG